MAVIDDLPGIEVTITSDGTPLPEYPDDDLNTTIDPDYGKFSGWHTSHYIECTTNQTFEITYTLHNYHDPECDRLRFEAHVDGEFLSCFIIQTGREGQKIVRSTEGKWVNDPLSGTSAMHALRFSSLNISNSTF